MSEETRLFGIIKETERHFKQSLVDFLRVSEYA